MTFIKFCGMTRQEDLDVASGLGVDAVGFVLWPGSPRRVEPGRLAALVRVLPSSVLPVAVFVRPTEDEVTAAIDAGIRAIQVHGAGSQSLVMTAVPVWIAATLTGNGLSPSVPGAVPVVLDAHDPVRHGGTGRTIDWPGAARIAAERRVILAGGLTADNVAQAIREVRPFGVDVASGIEQQPGIKSTDRMRAFAAAVREADR